MNMPSSNSYTFLEKLILTAGIGWLVITYPPAELRLDTFHGAAWATGVVILVGNAAQMFFALLSKLMRRKP